MTYDNSKAPFDTLAADHMKPNVVAVAHEVYDASSAYFQGARRISVMFGYDASSVPEHSAGTAVDFMVYSDWTLGDWVADYLWANRARLGLRWQIWRQRIRSTSPGKSGLWERMADRLTPTKNHMDHVHTNFWERAYTGTGSASSIPVVLTNAPKVSLRHLQVAIQVDSPAPGAHKTGFAPEVKLVEVSLAVEGCLNLALADGSAGTSTFGKGSGYQRWQVSLGYHGADADGYPGLTSLTELGRRHGWTVTP